MISPVLNAANGRDSIDGNSELGDFLGNGERQPDQALGPPSGQDGYQFLQLRKICLSNCRSSSIISQKSS